MRTNKIWAIIGALVVGGLGIAAITSLTQHAAEAGVRLN